MKRPRSGRFGNRRLLAAAAVVLVGLLAAAAAGWWWPALAALALLAGWQAWQLAGLDQLAREPGAGLPAPAWLAGAPARIAARIRLLDRQRRRRRRLLRDLVRELKLITESFPEPAVMLDEQNRIVWFNPAAAGRLQLCKPDDHGQPLVHILRHPSLGQWLAEDGPGALEIRSPADNNRILNVHMFVLNRRRRLLHFRDVTELRNVEQIRRDFVANVSHELRTPLTVLIGYLETLQEDEDDGIRHIARKMQEQTGAMRNLIDDLIELSRLQSDRDEQHHGPVDMASLMAALQEQAETLNNRRHDIRFVCAGNSYLLGNEHDLDSAFTNLITNAIRYTPGEGRIEVRWEITGEAACFSVTDNGIGIPREHLPRLTERFYRVARDRARVSGGSGLGLSIVKHVLNAHDARLAIESELDAGSTFTCLFPLQRLVDRDGNPAASPPGGRHEALADTT